MRRSGGWPQALRWPRRASCPATDLVLTGRDALRLIGLSSRPTIFLSQTNTVVQNLPPARIFRASVLASLAALMLSTHVFVSVDRVRAKVIQAPTPASAGRVQATTAGIPEVKALRPPFALIARINSATAGTAPFSITVDGSLVCERDVAGGGPRRVDCAVDREWSPAIVHDVTIQGPPTEWTLDYLELATHHGNTGGAHYVMVLPASSSRYVRPGAGWVAAAWLMLLAAMLLLPAPRPLPRWIQRLHRLVAGAVVLELAISQCSQWVSPYRIVLSAGTFASFLVLLFALRLWVAGRSSVQAAAAYLEARPAARRRIGLAAPLVVLCVGGMTGWQLLMRNQREQLRIQMAPLDAQLAQQLQMQREQARIQREQDQIRRSSAQARRRLFAELQPVRLANCTFERFGEPHDGGYVMCANLLASAQSAYSYGISGYDQWGCDVSTRLGVPVHQYDCFDLTRPVCPGGQAVFHEECVAGERDTIDGRLFETPGHQFAKNGHGAGRVVVKMDVEGAEWDTLLRAPDAVLQQIDQMAIELHSRGEDRRTIAAVMKLKQYFYVASLHFNNFSCQEDTAPFPADVYEVLFVNRRLGVPGGSGRAGPPASLLAPNVAAWKDCQAAAR